MLILFDIDGTLLDSHGLGRAGMEAAFAEMFGVDDPAHVDYAGRLDRWIFAAMCAGSGIEPAVHHERAFQELYTRHLTRLVADGPPPTLMPGVAALVDGLLAVPGVTLGLLTGNYEPTGRLKVSASGLDLRAFAVGAWGDDAEDRAELVPVATERLARATGRSTAPGAIVVVGDTEHDVRTARHNGCRSLAVASGIGSRESLAAAGPDLLVEDPTDTAGLLAWLGNGSAS